MLLLMPLGMFNNNRLTVLEEIINFEEQKGNNEYRTKVTSDHLNSLGTGLETCVPPYPDVWSVGTVFD